MRSITPPRRCRCRRGSNSAMTVWSSTSSEPRAIPAGRRAAGRVRVPPSKSLTHRYLNLALLARRAVVIDRPLLAEDTGLFLAALTACGWSVEHRDESVALWPPAGHSAAAPPAPAGVAGAAAVSARVAGLPGT